MTNIKTIAALVGVALFASGCSFVDAVADSVWPTTSGEDPAPPPQQTTTAPQEQPLSAPPAAAMGSAAPGAVPPPPPPLGSTTFEPTPVTPGSPTGTFVGRKVAQLRGDLQQMQGLITNHNSELQSIRNVTVQHSQVYHGVVAAINARLQVGSTPGNPVLVQQWNQGQVQLDQINGDIAKMNNLANKVAADSAMAAYLLESTRAAYGLSGAIEEDHRQLAILEDEVNRTVVLIDRLLNELSEDINRQTNYMNSERRNLMSLSLAIKNGELYGTSLANRAYATATPPTATRPVDRFGPTVGGDGRRPLVVIRFDRPNVEYQQALYTAISRVLEERPSAFFDLVAVAPAGNTTAGSALGSNAARRNAERVLRALTDMGLPAERIRLAATTSGTARTNEVHIYVR
jgi:TolA-binding protein